MVEGNVTDINKTNGTASNICMLYSFKEWQACLIKTKGNSKNLKICCPIFESFVCQYNTGRFTLLHGYTTVRSFWGTFSVKTSIIRIALCVETLQTKMNKRDEVTYFLFTEMNFLKLTLHRKGYEIFSEILLKSILMKRNVKTSWTSGFQFALWYW